MQKLNTTGLQGVFDKYSKDDLRFRLVNSGDINEEYFKLLVQLTKVGEFDQEKVSKFYAQHLENNPYFFLILVEPTGVGSDGKKRAPAGLGTLVIQPKLFRNLCFAGIIEDIVVSSEHRGKGLGTKITSCLRDMAESLGCYKVLLYCEENLQSFYEQPGLEKKGIMLAKYFN